MTLEFPHVDEIPLLVKLVSAGEQDVLPVSTVGQVLFAAGVFLSIARYKPERSLSYHGLHCI